LRDVWQSFGKVTEGAREHLRDTPRNGIYATPRPSLASFFAAFVALVAFEPFVCFAPFVRFVNVTAFTAFTVSLATPCCWQATFTAFAGFASLAGLTDFTGLMGLTPLAGLTGLTPFAGFTGFMPAMSHAAAPGQVIDMPAAAVGRSQAAIRV
jgi:hypothetical protein